MQLKLKYSEYDRIYREFYNARDEARLEEIIDEAIAAAEAQQMADGEDPLTDADKERITKKTRFDELTKGFHAPEAYAQYKAGLEVAEAQIQSPGANKNHKRNQSGMSSVKSIRDGDKKSVGSVEGDPQVPPYTPLVPEQWLDRCQEFSKFHIIKFPRLFQILFYFTKFKKREDICFFDTNKLSWKKAKEFLVPKRPGDPDLFSSIGAYSPFGPKDEEFAEYQCLSFIQDTLDEMNVNEIDGFSLALGKLYRWLRNSLELRIEDVTIRKQEKEKERKFRQDALDKEEERQQRRAEQLAAEKAKWEEIRDAELAALEGEDGERDEDENKQDLEFDMEEFDAKFDDDDPPVDIPPEVLEEVDNDFDLEINSPDEEEDEENNS